MRGARGGERQIRQEIKKYKNKIIVFVVIIIITTIIIIITIISLKVAESLGAKVAVRDICTASTAKHIQHNIATPRTV